MAFSELITSLQACKDQVFHLELSQEKRWRVVSGAPREEASVVLASLSHDFNAAAIRVPLPIYELDILQKGIQKLSLEPSGPVLQRLFKKTTKVSDSEAYRLFVKALDLHIDNSYLLHFEQCKRSLEYLVQNNDSIRFARLYRAIFVSEQLPEPYQIQLSGLSRSAEKEKQRGMFEAELNAFIGELVNSYPTCCWLKRVKEDLEWPCSLVPRIELATAPKRLDLRGCERTCVCDVLGAHNGQNYTHVLLTVDLCQEELISLAQGGCFASVTELDLRFCTKLEWRPLESVLVTLERLQRILLPNSLVLTSTPEVHTGWKNELKEALKISLRRIVAQQQSLKDFTYVSNLMRGVKGQTVLENSNRVQVNFILQAKDRLKELPQVTLLSASGIQKTPIDAICALLIRKQPIQLYLSFCPQITKEHLDLLLSVVPLEELFLRGCYQVDDSFFCQSRLVTERDWFTGTLNLVATSVTEPMVAKINHAQPRSKIVWDKTYLPNVATIQYDRGIDSQGLSEKAVTAVLHLVRTGYFPLLSFGVAIELIEHPLLLLRDESVRRQLKGYARHILQINVDCSTVEVMYEHAKKMADFTLLHICKIYIQTFYPAEISQLWDELSAEKKGIFAKMLHEQVLGEPDFSRSEDFLYFTYPSGAIHFTAKASPFFDLVKTSNVFHFIMRLKTCQPALKEQIMNECTQLFPNCKWLEYFYNHPSKADLLASSQGSYHVADLCECPPDAAIQIIKAFQKHTKLELLLEYSQLDLIYVIKQIYLDQIYFLDLRRCGLANSQELQPYLLQMVNLHNVLCANATYSDGFFHKSWANEMMFRMQINAYHQKASLDTKSVHPPLRTSIWHTRWYIDLQKMIAHSLGSNGKSGLLFQIAEPRDSANLQRAAILSLDYSGYFPKEEFVELIRTRSVKKLSLFGCAFVDDAYFSELNVVGSTIAGLQEVDLRGTQVSASMVAKLREAKIVVLYDEKYLICRKKLQKIDLKWSSLTKCACESILYFNYTGYYPLLSVELAMELVRAKDEHLSTKWRLKELQLHCLKFLLSHIDRKTVCRIYQFAKEIADDFLLSVCHYFIEFYCHPYYIQPQNRQEQALFNEVVHSLPPRLISFYDEIAYEKQKVTPLEPLHQDCPSVHSANLGALSSELNSGL